jgi:phosphohistidine phosphatase
MDLYLVRHGIAELRQGGRPDADRALTEEGIARLGQIGLGLRTLGCQPARMIASPLRRAQETARVLARVLGPELEIETCDALGPEGAPHEIVHWLGRRSEDAMLVGHLPGIAELAAHLLSARAGVDLTFRKGATCCLYFPTHAEAAGGRLEWLLQPRQLRALASGDADA